MKLKLPVYWILSSEVSSVAGTYWIPLATFPWLGQLLPNSTLCHSAAAFALLLWSRMLVWCLRTSAQSAGWMWQILCKPSGNWCPRWRQSLRELLCVCCTAALWNNMVEVWKQIKALRSHFSLGVTWTRQRLAVLLTERFLSYFKNRRERERDKYQWKGFAKYLHSGSIRALWQQGARRGEWKVTSVEGIIFKGSEK